MKDVSNNRVYEFYSVDLRDDFLEANSMYQSRSNATGVADYRNRPIGSVRKNIPAQRLSVDVYGGPAGASVTSELSASFTDSNSGISIGLSQSVAYNVPAYTYGYIVSLGNYLLNENRLEVRYLGTNNYVPAGKSYTISDIHIWTSLRTWK